jgi:hypothetical protein
MIFFIFYKDVPLCQIKTIQTIIEMEIICTNDKFPVDTLRFWELHGVSHPIEDKFYNIREAVRHFDGSMGFRLEEIVNPTVPIVHPILGKIEYEPTFDTKRFAKLSGEPLSKEEVEEYIMPVNVPSTFGLS